MATYVIDGVLTYDPAGGTSWSHAGDYILTDLSLDDTEADNSFEAGEGTFGGGFPYLGQVEVPLVAGGTMTLAVFDNGGNLGIFIPDGFVASDFIPPATIDTATLDTSDFPTCFVEGTLISTPNGQVAVQDLSLGGDVTTLSGTAKVKWIGRQTVSTRFGPAERLMPVRFAEGSLGHGLPTSDLTVTADHGMLVDGVICHAGALVNGTTITRVPLAEMGESYTVYHIETEKHEIILANGAAAETFIDNVSRRAFDNFAEFEALYGDVREMEELPYPRAMSARQVPDRIQNARDRQYFLPKVAI